LLKHCWSIFDDFRCSAQLSVISHQKCWLYPVIWG